MSAPLSLATDYILALRFARRELRGGMKQFRILIACLALGVAAIAAIGALSAAVQAGLERDAKLLLGGDVVVQTLHRPVTNDQRIWLERRADAVAGSVELRAMAIRPDGERRTLVQVKAVEDAYPLFGRLETDSNRPNAELLAHRDGAYGALLDPTLAERLGVTVGDRLRLGKAELTVRGLIVKEPDRSARLVELGPRLMIASEALVETDLLQPGSQSEFHYRLRLPAGMDAEAFRTDLTAAFPDATWRLRDTRQASPQVERFLDRITQFLGLVGLTALLVGGVGVGNAVAAYLAGKTATIATLKCLGASARLVFLTYLLLIGVLAGIGIGLGLVVGALAPAIVTGLFGALLPVPMAVGIYPAPLALAAGFGLLTALAFSLWPLGRARIVPAAALFRDTTTPQRGQPPLRVWLAMIVAFGALAGLAVATAPQKMMAAVFVAGAAAAFLLFRLAARGLMLLAAKAGRPRDPRLRLALANLHRPGAPTPSIVLSLGLGVTVLVAVMLVEGNMGRQIRDRLPDRAPTFFFIDIQAPQLAQFEALLAAQPGVDRVEKVPALRGRITKVKGVPVAQVKVDPEVAWAVETERGLTYAAEQPAKTQIVAGEWWPADYRGPPQISLDAAVAKGLGLSIGDSVTIGVLGREVEAKVVNFRVIDWTSLGINFTIVFAPGFLERAPHGYLAVAHTTPEAEEPLLRSVTDHLPNVSAIRVRDALEAAAGVLANIAAAARGIAALTLVAGLLVLAGALIAGHRRRLFDAVVLKVLGATRRDVAITFLLEYCLLGALTGLIAAVLGAVAAWAVLTFVMKAPFELLAVPLIGTPLLCVVATLLIGLAGTWRALGQKAAPLLREG